MGASRYTILWPVVFLFSSTVLGTYHTFDTPKSHVRGRHDERSLFQRNLETTSSSIPAMVNALDVMQSLFWSPASSNWPTGIDWTEATFNTDISTALSLMATYGNSTYDSDIQKYFSEVVAFYTGENITALVQEKYDDMQWVVLEWLEAIKFVNLYSSLNSSFDGQKYIPEFAHRARVFWDMASQGYNTTLCGGGMLWTDSLAPYKNAITNQLFVASSIGMYLYFPGDSNPNPSSIPGSKFNSSDALPPIQARDQRYLRAAITEYNWLISSNMTNSQGLYVDGFHITNYTSPSMPGTGKCDQRDESVYTYNQGVLLSGVRGLFDVSGNETYLETGYALVKSVINATGWESGLPNGTWAGLGADGILQDLCDVDGSCSQDNQNFKGIFFHHLSLFCQPLSMDEAMQTSQNTTAIFKGTQVQAQAHQTQCDTYEPWILHNAQAAYSTRNASGVYGGWWDPDGNVTTTASADTPAVTPVGYTNSVAGAADVMNKGIPDDLIWRLSIESLVPQATIGMGPVATTAATDPNNRGRGRTVETQSGGLGVMTCLVNAEES